MINTIKISNFCSIGKEQELSFKISSKDRLDNSSVEITNGNINLVNCIIGHNASGKTTAIKAVAFLFWLMGDSYSSMKMDETIPVEAHKLQKNKITKIEVEFFKEDSLFQYKVELDQKQIHKEFLGTKKSRGYSRIFEYSRHKNDWAFKPSELRVNESDLSRFKKRKNVSVLSSLIELGYLPDLSFIKNFSTNVTNVGNFPQHPITSFFDISKSLHENLDLQKRALSFIEDIDVGISSFSFAEAVRIKDGKALENEKRHILECVHESKLGKFILPLIEESNGTRHSLHLLTEILPVLKKGGVAVIDEIESGLHPYVAKKIISLFENRESNPLNAQLIFSTHQHTLLNDRTKTQIFIAEKQPENFETEIFRLDDVEGVRNDDNFCSKYLTGTYGGIPNIQWVDA